MANKCLICCMICCGIVVVLLLIAFLGVFVGIPVHYKNHIEVQRRHIFPITELTPLNPDFANYYKPIDGVRVRNLHVMVSTDNSIPIALGVWHTIPKGLMNNSVVRANFDYTRALAQSGYPVVLRFHSNVENRASSIALYEVLRNFFHVIAFDYRSYGDSTKAVLNEDGLVEDSVGLYKWLRAQTRADIYFWGHDLGSAVSVHTIAKLRELNIMPKGLFLEAPFTSLQDQMNETSLNKAFNWLAWYKSTMLTPLTDNGFAFNTTQHIASVECPIMILHAKDDDVSPYRFSEQLYQAAVDTRSPYQGNVTLHLLPEYLRCKHFDISSAPELPEYIQKHIGVCEAYNKGRN